MINDLSHRINKDNQEIIINENKLSITNILQFFKISNNNN